RRARADRGDRRRAQPRQAADSAAAAMTTPLERTRLRTVRALLIVGAASALVPGAWAAIAPRSFYDSFPGVGHWVRSLPAYNEHLAVDAGAFYLAFALLFAWAAVTLRRSLVLPLCAA